MLAENRPLKISIPHTSTCIIRTSGDVQDGDTVSVVSPVFSSTDFQTGSIVMTETFDVPIRILNDEKRPYRTIINFYIKLVVELQKYVYLQD